MRGAWSRILALASNTADNLWIGLRVGFFAFFDVEPPYLLSHRSNKAAGRTKAHSILTAAENQMLDFVYTRNTQQK